MIFAFWWLYFVGAVVTYCLLTSLKHKPIFYAAVTLLWPIAVPALVLFSLFIRGNENAEADREVRMRCGSCGQKLPR